MRKFIIFLLAIININIVNAQVSKIYKTYNGKPELVYTGVNTDSIVFCSEDNLTHYELPNAGMESTQISYWPLGYQKALCFTWDDGFRWQVEAITKVFDQYGFKTTYYLPTFRFWSGQNYIDTYKNACTNGHEIGSHTKNHVPLTTISLDSARYEIEQSSIDIETYLGYKPASLGHPERKFNTDIDEIVLSTYFTSRFSSILSYPKRLVHSIVSSDTSESLISEFESFYTSSNKWIVYSGHGLSASTIQTTGIYQPVDSAQFDNYLKYIKENYENEIWVATYDNIAIYEFIRDNVRLKYGEDHIYIDIESIKDIMDKYQRPNYYLTIELDKTKVSVVPSEAIIEKKIIGGKLYVTIDLRKGNYIFFNKL